MFERFLTSSTKHVTNVGATSGDTGSAAIDALAGRAGIDVFMLHPAGRISEVQRRQMTTVLSPNIHNIAIEGSFDHAQALVKAMFNDRDFSTRFTLSAVNSINWARLMAQVVYFFYAAVRLGAPEGGFWRELLNSDADLYGGGGLGNLGGVEAQPTPWHGMPNQLTVTLPPLGAVFFEKSAD